MKTLSPANFRIHIRFFIAVSLLWIPYIPSKTYIFIYVPGPSYYKLQLIIMFLSLNNLNVP